VVGLVAAGLVLAQRWRRARATSGEQQRLRERDEHARAARTRLLARLDHELKNPVQAIRAGVANARSSPGDGADDQVLASIDDQARRLARLVADLRKLGELESAPIETARVDPAEIVHEVAAATTDLPDSDRRDVRVLTPEIPWRVGAITGDRDLVFLAVMNLVANAVKFSPPGATIEVRALEEDRHAVIEVADTGIGIPDEEIDLVWEELARGAAARAVPGSGIGLALVRTIVDRHGGSVFVRSRVGQGTVVRLRFPLAVV
jgi:two-component system, OmpR family, sensor kinase